MRILITGGNGHVGRALRRVLTADRVSAPGRSELDVTDPASVDFAFAASQPEYVLHCAAMTDTRACEAAPRAARIVNAEGAEHVAQACARYRARLTYVSTNEVFDGESSERYREDDPQYAVNVYGGTKLLGETMALAAAPNTTIIRTAWVYGDGRDDFVGKVLAAAGAGRPLRFVTDEIATPTLADDLAEAMRALIGGAPAGIYHLTNEGEASRYEWAREIVRLAGLDESRVEPVTTTELRAAGYDGPRKPRYSVLANTRALALGIRLRPWREALAAHFERSRVAADG